MTFQNSVEWRPSTGTGRESTTAPEEEDDVMMMMEEERQQPQAASEDDEDENLNFPPLPALPPEAADAEGAASTLLGMASPARDLIRDIEHKF